MNNPLILLDVDETLIDTKYNLTCSASVWKVALHRAEAQGAIIGLNSDSAYEMLQKRARAYGMKGPIVAERGALVSKNPEAKACCTNVITRDFQKLRRAFLDVLTTGARLRKYLTVIGHVNEVANKLPSLPRDACLNDTAILVNSLRSCSLSFFVRKRCRIGWIKDEATLDEVIGIIDSLGRKRFPRLWEMRDIDRNPDYGICIFHHMQTKKSLACAPLAKLFGERKIYMIGNSMSDYMGDNHIQHCAVANAHKSFKDRCTLVADRPRTLGVIELIRKIIN